MILFLVTAAIVLAIAGVAWYIWRHRGDYDPQNLETLTENVTDLFWDYGGDLISRIFHRLF